MTPVNARTCYYGTFVHSKSLEELEISHNTAVFVDEEGRIAAIEKELPSVFAAHETLLKLGWTGEGQTSEHVENIQVEHMEDIRANGSGNGPFIWNGNGCEECRQYDERSEDRNEHLEHVGNGVHALSNGVSNGHTNGTKGHANGNGVSIEINGQVPKRPEVKLVVCGEEEFFFPGFVGEFAFLASKTPTSGTRNVGWY